MITIKLKPVGPTAPPLVVSWVSPIIRVYGIAYNLSELPDGATAKHAILGDVARSGNNYTVSLIFPHADNAPAISRFPADIVTSSSGNVVFPPYNGVSV